MTNHEVWLCEGASARGYVSHHKTKVKERIGGALLDTGMHLWIPGVEWTCPLREAWGL